MAGTIIADFIRTDANKLSLNVGNTTFATINASGFFSNTGTQLIAANGKVSGASLVSGSITSAAFATAANTIPRSSMTSGSVLQVVSTTKTDTFSSATTGSWLDITGLSVSITPTSATSKIMIFGRITGMGTNSVTRLQMRLARDSTAISVGDAAGSRLQVSGNELYIADGDGFIGSTIFFLDSPATTSATTYKIQIRNGNGSGTLYINRNPNDSDNTYIPRGTSSITVMEIAA